MALGLRRICSTDDFFNKRLNALTIHLINGGYKHCFIQQEINKVSLIPLSYPLETSPRQETDGVAFVVIFNPVLSNKNHVISDNLNILHSLQRCKEALPSPPLISYRRCNRHDILVRAKHRRPLPKTPGAFRCNRSSCKTCFFLTEKKRLIPSSLQTNNVASDTTSPVYLPISGLCIKLGRGQGDRGIGTRVCGDLGHGETRDLGTSSMGRGDVWDGNAGDVNDHCKSRR